MDYPIRQGSHKEIEELTQRIRALELDIVKIRNLLNKLIILQDEDSSYAIKNLLGVMLGNLDDMREQSFRIDDLLRKNNNGEQDKDIKNN